MATKQKCLIIGAVPIKSKKLLKDINISDYFVICADAGYETATSYGIKPDLIVGDFDSISSPPLAADNCIALPVEKDVTDTMYATMKGLELGYRYFLLLGCLGGKRFDHSIANLQVLQYIAEHSGVGIIQDETTKIIGLMNKRLKLYDDIGATISVFPMPKCNVTYKGLKYPLIAETLSFTGAVMGVSNAVEDKNAEIAVNSGMALVVLHNEE